MISSLIALFNLKIVLITLLIFLPLERLLPRCKQKVLRRHWKNDVVFLLINSIPIRFGLIMLTVIILSIAQKCVPAGFQARVAAQPLWMQLPELILLGDLGFYCAHRMFHAVPWLWKFHQVHHSIEHLDWLAGVRVHPLDQIITKGASLLFILPFGFSLEALVLGAAIYQFHSTFLHSNVNINFGPLKWLIASPEFHHWHHGNEKKAYDRNFAGQLSILDVVFRSLYMPQGRKPKKFGINKPVPQNYLVQLAYPFMDEGASRPAPKLSEQTG